MNSIYYYITIHIYLYYSFNLANTDSQNSVIDHSQEVRIMIQFGIVAVSSLILTLYGLILTSRYTL